MLQPEWAHLQAILTFVIHETAVLYTGQWESKCL